MKKIMFLLLVLVVVVSLAACQLDNSSTDPGGSNLDGSLEDLLAQIYETADVSVAFAEYIETGLQTTEITSENMEYHLGVVDMEFESAIASEPIMSPSAYELCLIRIKEGADIEQIKVDIKENVDPQKWVCVGVDPDNIIVDNIGDVVILIMSDDEGTALHEAFRGLEG